jgi:hypothetical protein
MKKFAYLLNILFILIGLVSILLALTSFMLFDAPGSENNNYVWLVFWSALALPIASFGAVIASLIMIIKLQNFKKAVMVFVIPIVVIALLVAGLVLIEMFCNGNFSC